MTLIVTLNGRESIWLLADRRLSYSNRKPKDDACKVMFLTTPDGTAILGYAGLGSTPRGTEPSEWMSAVLRGRNLPLEQSLNVLADAMQKQFPRHMARLPVRSSVHNLFTTAFVGNEGRLYTIDFVSKSEIRCTRYMTNPETPKARTPRIGIAGSGAPYLLNDTRWIRPLLRLLSAYDTERVSSRTVADQLASLNNDVHQKESSVGPRCIVAWRSKKGGIHKSDGYQFYTGKTREQNTTPIPHIQYGIDAKAFVDVVNRHFDGILRGSLNTELGQLPYDPDEKLR
jgi:hypothetical protein